MNENPLPDLIYRVIQEQRARDPDRPALIGVSGAQGSGKTTVCQLLEAANRPRFAQFSIDDVYLSRAERESRADAWVSTLAHKPSWRSEGSPHAMKEVIERTRPLFVTRGPPGTHDIGLARGVIARLGADADTPLPRFDKIADRPVPDSDRPVFKGPAEAILVDGWCLGALPTPEWAPLNDVERDDIDGEWQSMTNVILKQDYVPFFAAFDAIIYLRAPSWDIVRRWRREQEATLRGRALTAEEEAWIDRFILHYERITRSMMEGRVMADRIVQIDELRRVVSVTNPPSTAP